MQRVPAKAVRTSAATPGVLSPKLYPTYRRRLSWIHRRQQLRKVGDSLGQRWLASMLTAVLAFLAALPVAILLPGSIVWQLTLAIGASLGAFGGLLVLMHLPNDQMLADERRTLEAVMPQLEQGWKQHCLELAAAREAERVRLAEARRLATERRQQAAEAERKRAAEAQRQHALRSGTAALIFDNQTDSPALVKVMGPGQYEVTAPKGGTGTLQKLPAGRYLIKVRYGTSEADYSYSEGDPFQLDDHSLCRITLHKVVGGNYGSRRINKGSF